MKNYAEEIAYWYFRFNGYFLLNNYVSHGQEMKSSYYADSDLIGIRLKNVKEGVGLCDKGDICKILLKNIPDIFEKTTGIICEVKGGCTTSQRINNSKLESCINRMGFFNEKTDLKNAIEILKNNSMYTNKDFSIYKIFAPAKNSQNNIVGWDKIEIATMIKFIKERIKKYDIKSKAWNHYFSNAIQYLYYEERLKDKKN